MVYAWESSILSALEDRESSDKNVKKLASKADPLNHKLVRQILPEYLDQISAIQAEKVDLEAQVKASSGGGDGDDDGEQDTEVELSAEEMATLKKRLTSVRKQLKVLQKAFVEQLGAAVVGLDQTAAEDLVLAILRAELANDPRPLRLHTPRAHFERI